MSIRQKTIKTVKSILNRFGIDIVRYYNDHNIAQYRKLYTSDVLEKRPFYNVGAGGFSHPYWTNIDYVSDWYGDMQQGVVHHDLMSKEPLPIKDKAAKIIYTSHTIEHIKEDAVQVLFDEAHRCLEEGGIFRITTGPDAETDFRAFQRGDEDWFYWDEAYNQKGRYEHLFHAPATSVPLAERWLHHVASQLAPNDISPSKVKLSEPEILAAIEQHGFPAVLDHFASLCEFQPERPGNHVSWWTHDKIFDYLKRAGFKIMYRSGYNQSVSPLLRNSTLFDSTHPQMSIYVEAIKEG
jgi:predicted SAM-dependent methyltransferase